MRVLEDRSSEVEDEVAETYASFIQGRMRKHSPRLTMVSLSLLKSSMLKMPVMYVSTGMRSELTTNGSKIAHFLIRTNPVEANLRLKSVYVTSKSFSLTDV